MEDQKFAPSVHDTTHSHAWMFALLIGCVALIIALLGLFAYQYYEPQESEINGEPLTSDDVENSNEENIATESFSYLSTKVPSFDYSSDWNVYAETSFRGTNVYIDDDPIIIVSESEGPVLKIMIRAFENTPEARQQAAWHEDAEVDDTYFYSVVNSMALADVFEGLDWEFVDVTDEYACGYISGSYNDNQSNIWPNTPFMIEICESTNYVVSTSYYDYDKQPPATLQNVNYDNINW